MWGVLRCILIYVILAKSDTDCGYRLGPHRMLREDNCFNKYYFLNKFNPHRSFLAAEAILLDTVHACFFAVSVLLFRIELKCGLHFSSFRSLVGCLF